MAKKKTPETEIKKEQTKTIVTTAIITAFITALAVSGGIYWFSMQNSVDQTIATAEKSFEKDLEQFQKRLQKAEAEIDTGLKKFEESGAEEIQNVRNELEDLKKEIGRLQKKTGQYAESGAEKIAEVFQSEPADVVMTVYDNWRRVRGTALADNIYEQDSEYFTSGFEQKLEEMVENFAEGDPDPLFCEREAPTELEAEKTLMVNPKNAQVIVEANFPTGMNRKIKISLIQQNDTWKIYNVSCPEALNKVIPEAVEVDLFYYNQPIDEEINGYVACSEDSVRPVKRKLLISDDPVLDSLNLLLTGGLTEEETKEGFSTEFPGEGFLLVESELEDGVLTLRFDDPENFTVGGSCRTSLLKYQVEKTALQFPEVQEVVFEPENLFQP